MTFLLNLILYLFISEDSEHQDHEEDQNAINQSYNEIKGDIFDKKLLKEGILSRSDSM